MIIYNQFLCIYAEELNFCIKFEILPPDNLSGTLNINVKSIPSEFAHLMDDEDIDTIKAENVCSTVGKEDKNAVEKSSA